MQIFDKFRDNQSFGLILISMFLALGLGWTIGIGLLEMQVILILVVALILGIIMLSNRQLHRNILLVAYAGLIFGWRSISLFSSGIYFYPGELLIWFGFIAFLALGKNAQRFPQLPRPALWLSGFTLLGIAAAVFRAEPLAATATLDEAKSFIIFIPLIILLRKSVTSIAEVTRYTGILVIAGFLIAVSGVFEYYSPSVSDFAANLIGLSSGEYLRYNFASERWIRLSPFYLWGTPVVAVILVPLFGAWTAVLARSIGGRKWLWAGMGPIIAAGIALSGYRSAWVGLLTVAISMFVFTRKSAFFAWTILGAYFTALPFAFTDRFRSILNFTESSDSAILLRLSRLSEGFEGIFQHPFWGTGWGSKVMFNDWLYFAVALGLPAFIVFVYWYGKLLVQLYMVMRRESLNNNHESRDLAAGFLIGLLGYAVSMTGGGP